MPPAPWWETRRRSGPSRRQVTAPSTQQQPALQELALRCRLPPAGAAQDCNAHSPSAVWLQRPPDLRFKPSHCPATHLHRTAILSSLSPAPWPLPPLQVFSDLSHVKMNGTKSMIGHCLGAGGGAALRCVKSAVLCCGLPPPDACCLLRDWALGHCLGAGGCCAVPPLSIAALESLPPCACSCKADASLLPALPCLPLPAPCSWRHGGDSHHPRHPDRLGAPHHQQREHPA